MSEKDLEETIKGKVSPLLEETMEKSWGITIPQVERDITDQLFHAAFKIYVPPHFTFQEAKKFFKKEFLKKELRLHFGNISQMAKELDLDRRSIHRAIKELKIDVSQLRVLEDEARERFYEGLIDETIRFTLQQYEKVIHPEKMEKMYQEIPSLSRNIAKFLPPQKITWKEAEEEFEKQYLSYALKENNWKISETARKLELRSETLHRKIKKLRLK